MVLTAASEPGRVQGASLGGGVRNVGRNDRSGAPCSGRSFSAAWGVHAEGQTPTSPRALGLGFPSCGCLVGSWGGGVCPAETGSTRCWVCSHRVCKLQS